MSTLARAGGQRKHKMWGIGAKVRSLLWFYQTDLFALLNLRFPGVEMWSRTEFALLLDAQERLPE
jgi:hypothetical protein